MKIDLIQPPPWVLYGTPLIAIPLLAGALKREGHDVEQFDLNLEIRDDFILKPEIQSKHLAKLDDMLRSEKIPEGSPGFIKTVALLDRLSNPLEQLNRLNDSIQEELRTRVFRRSTYGKIIDFQQVIAACYPGTKWVDYDFEPNKDFDLEQILGNGSFNPFYDFTKARLEEHMKRRQPDLVGISLQSPASLLASLTISDLVRKHSPDSFIVMGGDYFRTIKKNTDLLNRLFAKYTDAIIMHEGETPLSRLVGALENGERLDQIPNLMHKTSTSFSPASSIMLESNLKDKLPSFDGLRLERYVSLPLEINRGCYFAKCTFCRHATKVSDVVDELKLSYRRRTVDSSLDLVEEIVKKHGINIFEFSGLAYSPHELDQFSEGVIKRGLDIKWGCRPRIERGLTHDIMDKMVESGVYVFHLAIETFNARLQALLAKNYDVDIAKDMVTYLKKTHAQVPIIFNIMYDIPTETVSELDETIDYLRDNGLTGEFFKFWLDNQSAIYLNRESFGIEVYERTSGLSTKSGWRHKSAELEAMRAEKIQRILDLKKAGIIQGERDYFDFGNNRTMPDSPGAKVIYFMSNE